MSSPKTSQSVLIGWSQKAKDKQWAFANATHHHLLQKRIYRASLRGNVKLVHRLQRLLIKSWYARLWAVRRVTQDNQGKRSAGIDGQKNLTSQQRMALAWKLNEPNPVSPTRRVWIDKPGSDQKRPLGIPTIGSYCTSFNKS